MKNGVESALLYSNQIHSRKLGYMRFEERMHSLRKYPDMKKYTNVLGMKLATNEEALQLRFVKLARDLD